MKHLTLITFALLTLNALASESNILVAGSRHACVLDSNEVKCWGDNGVGQTEVPKLVGVKQLSAGASHTCALDAEGVKCWGFNNLGQLNVPKLHGVKQIAAGYFHTCALDSEGVKCWGDTEDGKLDVPRLYGVKQLVAGARHTCALDSEGIKCWGNPDLPYVIPNTQKVKHLISGGYFTCGLYDEVLLCWNEVLSGFRSGMEKLHDAKQVSTGMSHYCALDADEVKCWGEDEWGETKVPYLREAKEIAVGWGFSCALDLEGVKCWGNNSYGQTDVPKLNFGPSLRAPDFDLTNLAEFLEVIASGSTPARTMYFKNLKHFIDASLTIDSNAGMMGQFRNKAARYTLAALLYPAISSGDSQYYLENVIPAYESSLKLIEVELGLFGLSDIPDLPLVRLVALRVIQASLSVMNEFLTLDERKELMEVNRLLGSAMASVTDRTKILSFLDQLEKSKSNLTRLQNSSKSAFLFDSLQTAEEFLNLKVR